VTPEASHAQLLRTLVSKHFATPAPASRFGNIFATAQSGPSPKPAEPGRSGPAPSAGYGDGSKAFRANLAAQGIPQRPNAAAPSVAAAGRHVPPRTSSASAKPKAAVPPEVVAAFKMLLLDVTATEEQVKKSYRRLALRYHP
ncbi:unnamed protein product, partial [Cladocopium goreaui]